MLSPAWSLFITDLWRKNWIFQIHIIVLIEMFEIFTFTRKKKEKNCRALQVTSWIIWQSKLFVIQTLLEIAELQNYRGSSGSRYGKRIFGDQWWILSNNIFLAWGWLDSPGGTSFWCRLQSRDSDLPLREIF